MIIAFIWTIYKKKEDSKFPYQFFGYSKILLAGFLAFASEILFYTHEDDTFKFYKQHYIIFGLYFYIAGSSILYDEYIAMKKGIYLSNRRLGWVIGPLFILVGIYLLYQNFQG
jgi:hypothetical protein